MHPANSNPADEALGYAMTTACDYGSSLASLLSHYRHRYDNEGELQASIAKVLGSHGIAFEREVRLSDKDRPDFMVGGVAIEVKVASSRADVLRQLARYAEHPEVSGMVLVTSKACHLNMPAQLLGKPLAVCSLLGGAF
jgi:hypothetical protein